MRATLTDRTIRTLQPPARGQRDYFDARLPGFGLRVTANDARSWVVLYSLHNRKRRLTLGPYPRLSLADARTRAREVLASVVKGDDPAAEKLASRAAATFEQLAHEYVEKYAEPKKRSWREDKRILRVYVPKSWRHAPASTITRRDVRALLHDIKEHAPIQANRVLACLRKVFNYGIANDLVEGNPCARIEQPGTEKSRDRVLSTDELRAVWKALDAESAQTAALVRFFLLTAQRPGELRTARWENIDLDGGCWTIPAERAKNNLAHRVPLSPPAVAILRDLQANAKGSSWVFPGVGASGHRETVQKAINRIRRCGRCAACEATRKKGHATRPCETPRIANFRYYDLRRTVTTFLTSELKVSRLTARRILNHAERDVTAIYDRASYDTEKRAALDAWARKLHQIVTGELAAKVVPLPSRSA